MISTKTPRPVLAITGDPGLTGMNPVAALSADDLYNALNPPLKDTSMNEQLRQLLTALGLTVADGDEFTPELGTAALSALCGDGGITSRRNPLTLWHGDDLRADVALPQTADHCTGNAARTRWPVPEFPYRDCPCIT